MIDNADTKDHRAQAAKRLSPVGRQLFKYIEFDENEELLAEIRKHPIGAVFIFFTGIFIAAFLLFALIALSASLNTLGLESGDGDSVIKVILIAAGLVLAAIGLLVTAITLSLYRRNVVYVTNEKIAQVTYKSIFHREVVQLGVGKIEDVTVTQRGILPHLFNYGTLLIETAGELPNCSFAYVPKPHDNSHIIIEAHEAYVEKYGN